MRSWALACSSLRPPCSEPQKGSGAHQTPPQFRLCCSSWQFSQPNLSLGDRHLNRMATINSLTFFQHLDRSALRLPRHARF